MKIILGLIAFLMLPLNLAEAGTAPRYRKASNAVGGEYIVRLVDRAPESVPGIARSIAATYDGEIIHFFPLTLGGFSIRLAPETALRLAEDPRVEFVEENGRSSIDFERTSGRHSTAGDLWYLDRIDGRMDGFYSYCTTGRGVYAYIVDEGVDKNARWCNQYACFQAFFSGQVEPGVSFTGGIADDPCPTLSYGAHGTAVAGFLAGANLGVAPDTSIIPVQTVTCAGGVVAERQLAGLEWVVTNDQFFDGSPGKPRKRPALVNLSWWMYPQESAPGYSSIEIAVDAVIARGISVFTSANNYPMQNSCNRAPASLGRYGPGAWGITATGQWQFVQPRVITVGGTMLGNGQGISTGDYRWQNFDGAIPRTGRDEGSTWGQCISLWAPAKDVRILHHIDDVAHASGTSFSSPQVAGLAARYLQSNPTATVDDVWLFLQQRATSFVAEPTINSPPSGGGRYLVEWYDYCLSRPVTR